MSYLESLCKVNSGVQKRVVNEINLLENAKLLSDGIYEIAFRNGSMTISTRDRYPFKAPMISIVGFTNVVFKVGKTEFYSYYDSNPRCGMEMLSIHGWMPNVKIQQIINELEKM